MAAILLASFQAEAVVLVCKDPGEFIVVNDALKLRASTYAGETTYTVRFPPAIHDRHFVYAELVVGSPNSSVTSYLHPDWSVDRDKDGWLHDDVVISGTNLSVKVIAHYGVSPCTTTTSIVVRK
jgi:hypothetical protein